MKRNDKESHKLVAPDLAPNAIRSSLNKHSVYKGLVSTFREGKGIENTVFLYSKHHHLKLENNTKHEILQQWYLITKEPPQNLTWRTENT